MADTISLLIIHYNNEDYGQIEIVSLKSQRYGLIGIFSLGVDYDLEELGNLLQRVNCRVGRY